MSDTSSESNDSESGKGITDDQLPDDLNPEKNPLAQDPDKADEAGQSPGPGAGGETGPAA